MSLPPLTGPFADRSITSQVQQSSNQFALSGVNLKFRSQLSSIPTERSDILYEQTGEPFQYSLLEHHDSVRLLRLHPSRTSTAAISCSFLDVPLSTNPEYEVLSGFWGDQPSFQPVPLLVDGRSCITTPQLVQALYKFRHRDRPRLLWIQSLCVDPRNLGERSGQIARLRDILLSARRVIVWLGAAEDDSNHAFEHLGQFAHLVNEEDWPPPLLPDARYGRETTGQPGAPGASDHVQPYTGNAVAAFVKLCSRPWFYRPWSITELALSNNILLVCGDHQLPQVPWHNPISPLVEAYPFRHQFAPSHGVSLFADLNIPVVDAVAHVSSLSFHPRILNHPYPWLCDGLSMGNAYRIVRNCRANDRRDSVFAIASLESIPPVDINYQLSVSEIYQQATFALLQVHRSIQVLRRLASPSRASDLSSWTLDFSTPLETTGAIWALPGCRFLKDRVSPKPNDEEVDAQRRGLWPCDSQVPQPRLERGKLMLTGRLMETVTAIGQPMPAAVATDQTSRAFADILAAWEDLASRLQPTKRFPQSIADAFFDTLIANDTHDVLGNNPPRPLVSPVADRARKWYMRHGTGILRDADGEYFAVLDDGETHARAQPVDSVHDVLYDIGQIWRSSREGEAISQEFGRRVARACACKRFFITDQGSMGLAPSEVREGDVIVFLPTGAFPLFLRPRGDKTATTAYRLLGEGFLYDWWRHIEPGFEHRVKMGSYGDLLTEFVIE